MPTVILLFIILVGLISIDPPRLKIKRRHKYDTTKTDLPKLGLNYKDKKIMQKNITTLFNQILAISTCLFFVGLIQATSDPSISPERKLVITDTLDGCARGITRYCNQRANDYLKNNHLDLAMKNYSRACHGRDYLGCQNAYVLSLKMNNINKANFFAKKANHLRPKLNLNHLASKE